MYYLQRIRGILIVPLAVIMLITGISGVTKNEQIRREEAVETATQDDFVPVFRFAITSDTHLRTANDPRNAERLAEMFRTAYAYADNHPTYQCLDAVLLAGDIVDSGHDDEYAELNRVVSESIREGTEFITVMGNHEYHYGGHEGYMRNMNTELDVHKVIKGFHIIGLSTDPTDTWHTPLQLNWLSRQLREAAKDDPEKPIFTMQHGHIWNTVYVSRSWYTQMSLPLHMVYSQYPQVVNFSGHSHGPVNNPINIWQNNYTTLGCGTLNYFEMERDIGDDTVPAGADRAAQYTIVEVDANNRVRLQPFNILTGDFFKTPSNTDDPDKQLVWQIDKPSDPKSFAYTKARKKTDSAPWFEEGAEITAQAGANDVSLTFEQAKADVCVYGYRIQIAKAAKPKKIVAEKEIYAEYYFEPMPETQSVTIDGLEPGTDYIARVIPLNVWLAKGEPLTTGFTTAP